MPPRKLILATGETYHVFNRSPRGIPIFTNKAEYGLFLTATKYYFQSSPPVKFSLYREQKDKYEIDLNKTLINCLSYCLMPNHFHFLLIQLEDNGIKTFIQKLTGSYSHYFNLKHELKGSLFENRFKAVRVTSEEQLVHLSRYIHLNPVTAYLVENPVDYRYSSYKAYLGEVPADFIDSSIVMNNFNSPTAYKKFVLDRKDYQRELDSIKHLLFE